MLLTGAGVGVTGPLDAGTLLSTLEIHLKACTFLSVFSFGISLIIAEPSLKTTTQGVVVTSNYATT